MGRRLFLPLTKEDPARPTIDAVRARLGGRAVSDAGVGEIVALGGVSVHAGQALAEVEARLGVVLFARGADLDVWFERDVMRRLRRDRLRAASGAIPEAVRTISADARIFAGLHEGQVVLYQHATGLGEGKLVEKCRFGGLIARTDGTVLGVGFRRVWPASPPANS